MHKGVESSWQSWLIAFGLLIMIPVTFWLGMNVVAPKIDLKQYLQLHNEYFKQCRHGQNEQFIDYEKCDKEWQKSQAFILYQQQIQNRSDFELMVSAPVVLFLVAASSFINIAIMSASFIGSAIILGSFYVVFERPMLEKTTLIIIWQFVMALASLVLVLWYAYRASKLR